MKIQNNTAARSIILLIVTLLIFMSAPVLAAPSRVAILPFDMHAEKDLTFLQEGILDMLGSRLAWKDKVEVINKNETKAAFESIEGFDGESRALLAGGKLKADYVLFGSLTVFGESVSIDARMVDVSGQQEPLPFFAQTRGMGEVIPKINEFATNINAKVFGRQVARRPVAAPAAQSGTAPSQPVQQQPTQQAYDPRMHPEKLLQSGVQSENQVPIAGQPYQAPNPDFVVAPTAGTTAAGRQNFWRSRNFNTLISGIDIGDVDNDGKMETVLATENMIAIYQFENGRLMKESETAITKMGSYISVDIGDLNGNGTPEIYITGLESRRSIVNSIVLEYNGTDYQQIGKGNNWFYRLTKTTDRGMILLGQRQRAAESSIFANPLFEMQWQDDGIVPKTKLLGGGKANIIGADYGDVTHTGNSVLVAYSPEDRLRIYGNGDQVIYKDSDRTGGNMSYFLLPKVEPDRENKQYFPLRVRITDIDRDGKAEVMVANHSELARNMLQSFRSFKSGWIQCMEWNGLALASKWKTQEFKGRISDFVVGDFDNDGLDELVTTVVVKEGSIILTDALSKIIAFDLIVNKP
ncbi:FG-GAP-like repeat-containing protein [uncultured Desulfosarcina sp.]|uniref:FG-GAP-like repeat-containing protein n=1 Tax=uncultured Desulfosarcina sp. TaxID=218289 RepID=UPI0029C6EE67|nr:FG-GAP-like repeat-containing protein [uncultured Desulfosarcina sp.]